MIEPRIALAKAIGFGLIGFASMFTFGLLVCVGDGLEKTLALIPFLFLCGALTGINRLDNSR
jgi:hypothetical protein